MILIERHLARIQPAVPLLFLALAPRAEWQQAKAVYTENYGPGPAIVLSCTGGDFARGHSYYRVCPLPPDGTWSGASVSFEEKFDSLLVAGIKALADSINKHLDIGT